MWNQFEASSNEDETLGGSFFTNGLFKISNEQIVRKFQLQKKKRSLFSIFPFFLY
jgi:hypothetical protein